MKIHFFPEKYRLEINLGPKEYQFLQYINLGDVYLDEDDNIYIIRDLEDLVKMFNKVVSTDKNLTVFSKQHHYGIKLYPISRISIKRLKQVFNIPYYIKKKQEVLTEIRKQLDADIAYIPITNFEFEKKNRKLIFKFNDGNSYETFKINLLDEVWKVFAHNYVFVKNPRYIVYNPLIRKGVFGDFEQLITLHELIQKIKTEDNQLYITEKYIETSEGSYFNCYYLDKLNKAQIAIKILPESFKRLIIENDYDPYFTVKKYLEESNVSEINIRQETSCC